jgi:hypothetical protein
MKFRWLAFCFKMVLSDLLGLAIAPNRTNDCAMDAAAFKKDLVIGVERSPKAIAKGMGINRCCPPRNYSKKAG